MVSQKYIYTNEGIVQTQHDASAVSVLKWEILEYSIRYSIECYKTTVRDTGAALVFTEKNCFIYGNVLCLQTQSNF